MERGDLGRAEADLDEALRSAPGHDGAWLERGRLRLLQGRFAEGLADLSSVSAALPSMARFYRGTAFALQGERGAALSEFAEVAADASSSLAAFATLCEAALGERGARLEALAAEEGWPAPLARSFLGRLPEEGLLLAAEEARDEALRRSQRRLAHGFLGLAAEGTGDAERARRHYDAYLASGGRDLLFEWVTLRRRALSAEPPE
jgi:hypothetical protein